MSVDKRERLAGEVTRLKKAWLLAAAVRGIGKSQDRSYLAIPAYIQWENKRLKRETELLKDDLQSLAKQLLASGKASEPFVKWCASQYDKWSEAKEVIFEVGRVQDVEKAIGRLAWHRFMECPPYAQVLLQGFTGAAIRHPEYHLARDVALLWNLFLDAERICDESLKSPRPMSSEHSQSLARSVIITCYNLLESFVSGLAMAWRMENPAAAAAAKLPKDMAPLHERFFAVPAAIVGRETGLDRNQSPFAELFGDLKRRRDAFVHCDPGPTPTKLGYLKEEHFHDVSPSVVREVVNRTSDAIRLVWKAVHGKDKPMWLPTLGLDGRFPRIEVALRQAIEQQASTATTTEPAQSSA
jgi:hypothetical protein